ncbi:hypothetical protein BCV70DRAFT_210682 [Testicularia cyperi]|uniref:DNA polymerase delta subunit 4 n=1 Tax=Testicularia cyperi TaxID=1882483 RepID=A0A317XVV0_9BASI|nr:hypothetical protein BCV70DRAFT_210682 [Testicularia cyperi]
MLPKTQQNRLRFRAQSKPKSSFSTLAKDAAGVKSQKLLSSRTTPTAQNSSSLRAENKANSKVPTKEAGSDLPVLDVDDGRWDALWRKTKKQLNAPPSKTIHIDHENRVEQMLRVFDLDPSYGPCMGLSRLERWHRAHDLELNPPQEIFDILNTRQGVQTYATNIFTAHGL